MSLVCAIAGCSPVSVPIKPLRLVLPTVPIFAERAEIVNGKKEAPPPKEGEEAEEKGAEEGQAEGEAAEADVPPGIPEFWLNVLRNYEDIGEKVNVNLSVWVIARWRG